MANKTTTFIRIIVSILLLIGVYNETGIFTTITLGLVLISIEVTTIHLKNVSRQLRDSEDDFELAKKMLMVRFQ